MVLKDVCDFYLPVLRRKIGKIRFPIGRLARMFFSKMGGYRTQTIVRYWCSKSLHFLIYLLMSEKHGIF